MVRTPRNISVKMGESITVNCAAQGPSPTLSLAHNSTIIAAFTSSSKVSSTGNVFFNFSKLNSTFVGLEMTIIRTEAKHAGSYKCQAKSEGSSQTEDEAIFFVSVDVAGKKKTDRVIGYCRVMAKCVKQYVEIETQ